MTETVRDVMTPDPFTLPESANVREAAKLMRDKDIGDVVITDDGRAIGMLTDRDIVIRAVAEGSEASAAVGEICSRHLVTCTPEDAVDDCIEKMRDKAVRRILVCEGDEPVGVVSLGDLAVERDRRSALGEISAAPPTH